MRDDPRRALIAAARLDGRARAVVEGLDDPAAQRLLHAWEGAVARQDAEVDEAVEGSLSLVPRLLRKRVLHILTRGRS